MFKKKVRQKRTPVVPELPDRLILGPERKKQTNDGRSAHEKVNSFSPTNIEKTVVNVTW